VRIDNGSWTMAHGAETWDFFIDPHSQPSGWHTVDARAYDGSQFSEICTARVIAGGSSPPSAAPALAIVEWRCSPQ